MPKQIITTDQAPAPVGAYSQAIKAGGFVFCSGQIPLTSSGDLITGDITDQTKQVMENLKAVLEAAGCTFGSVVKATMYLTDVNDFAAVNEVYSSYVGESLPARAVVPVPALPKGVNIEVEMIAEA